MVYFTGDIHGAIDSIDQFNRKVHPTKDDVIVLLGDIGANYYRGRKDERLKEYLNQIGPVFLCIHGNHEIRPTNIPGYTELQWNGGFVWAQPEYPNLLFARDGEIFELNGLRYLVIGGAYSVDKFYRIRNGWGWWPDEQPSDEIKAYVERQIQEKPFDIVLSHTCPFKYEPMMDYMRYSPRTLEELLSANPMPKFTRIQKDGTPVLTIDEGITDGEL